VVAADQKEHTDPIILIVNDEPENTELLELMLNDLGFQSRTANTGEEALQMVESEKPDLILLDVQMPEMDGYKVCEQLRDNPETKRIPIIMATSQVTDAHEKVKGLRSGASDFLMKPFEQDELVTCIEAQLYIKELEDQRVLNEKRILLDQLVTTLQHEIINPLSGILGYSELMLKQMQKRQLEPEEIEKALETIHSSSERIQDVMEKLKNLYSITENTRTDGATMIDLTRDDNEG
jgi:DNA-binding response OmpR family regulator